MQEVKQPTWCEAQKAKGRTQGHIGTYPMSHREGHLREGTELVSDHPAQPLSAALWVHRTADCLPPPKSSAHLETVIKSPSALSPPS